MIRSASVATVVAPRRTSLARIDVAEPGPGEVRVAIQGCGVCGSNVPMWEGRPWFTYPMPGGAPGHEAWGEVDAVGPGTDGLRVGTPVALLSSNGFAEAALVAASDVVALPEDMRGAPFPGEALGCGFNIARRSRYEAGTTVAVVGVGFIGAMAVRLAVAAGARVIAISRRRSSLDLAVALGAAHTIVMDDQRTILEDAAAFTDGELCATVVEAVGTQWPLDLAGALTACGGRLVIAGYHQEGLRSVDMQLWNWRGIDVINAHERNPDVVRRGVIEAAAAVTDGWLQIAPLLTHTFPLEQLDRALETAARRPEGFVKALVVV